ncbi:uncharacterized protein C8R40DRAFT_1255595 [Lentinula edodes]|uniref:uncharacterized protein n=1 Tax=Lentinula edodes TaxID=5353 RepID=UPI001E8D4F1E|nr:uncharacterized protein C8R40DRAFT_1255595 [Lentinula edodes]KAH7872085.1 hypothetical protein C8R40DRAFT_1255595 [Lentinula edodes]
MSSISSATSASTATFITALVFNGAVFGIEIAIFTLIRPYFKAIYEPRTYVPPKARRIQSLTSGGKRAFGLKNALSWPLAVFQSNHQDIKLANGLDAYFFVRYLRMMVVIFLPIWILSWVVLLPVTSVNTQVSGNTKLNRFIFGNVAPDKSARYAAHIIMAWVFTGWIFFIIWREMRHWLYTRQYHLIDSTHSKSVQANTVLITGIPQKYLTHAALHKVFDILPGGVKNIWINRDLKELPDIYDRRLKACNKLESAENKLLSIVAKRRLKADKQSSKEKDPEAQPSAVVPEDERPTHKLGFLGLFGEKVDSIEWARSDIRVCNELLEAGRAKIPGYNAQTSRLSFHPDFDDDGDDDFGGQGGIIGTVGKVGNVVKRKNKKTEREPQEARAEEQSVDAAAAIDDPYPVSNSAFITFRKQISAHLAGQSLIHHEPYRMSSRYIEVAPSDVIWSNLSLNPFEIKIRIAISWAITIALIVFWALPVAFIGTISNIQSVCQKEKWLAWLCSLPSPVVGIIQGILPPVLLAVLMMLLPIFLRLLAKFEGIPKRSGVELSLMTRYFIFQVIHSFLIVTLSSGIIASLQTLTSNPTSIPSTLASSLPQASIFFLTYIILQGLSGTAGGFLQIVPLAIYYVKLFLLGSTPRSVWGIKYGKRSVAWGTLFPNTTLLTVIALGYSVIAPIINGLVCATFFAFYMLYKYLFLWAYQQDLSTDTGGLFFPKAIQHLFVGLYVEQVCLAALFFLARDENNAASAIPEGALMIVLLIFTAFFQIILNNMYNPLKHALPLSMSEKMYHEEDVTPAVQDESSASAKDQGYPMDRVESKGVRGASVDDDRLKLQASDNDRQSNGEDSTKPTPDRVAPRAEESYGFSHPAASRPQRTVWIPKDRLGLAQEEEIACRDKGIDISTKDAEMNEKGKVNLTGDCQPPDLVVE